MKSRILLYIAIGFLILGIAWLVFSTPEQEPSQVFAATVNRDCAPWDGAAFTVKIPMNDGTMISVSIYQSPESMLPATFSFPDETGRTGNALLLLPIGEPEELSGKISLPRLEQGVPVEGTFDLLTEKSEQFKGNFKAEWENEI